MLLRSTFFGFHYRDFGDFMGSRPKMSEIRDAKFGIVDEIRDAKFGIVDDGKLHFSKLTSEIDGSKRIECVKVVVIPKRSSL